MGWLIFAAIFVWLAFSMNASQQKRARLKEQNRGKTFREQIHDENEPLDDDVWDTTTEFVPSHPKPISATLALHYRDAKGAVSERVVVVRECDTTNPAGYLLGVCQLRNAFRTFRINRIEKAVDVDTGEIIRDIPAYAQQKYQNSPAATIEKLLNESMDVLRCLFYIAKSDGRFTAKEKMLFLDYCHHASGNTDLTVKDIESICRDMPMASMQAYRLICGRLTQLPAVDRAKVLEIAQAMVASERTIAPEEQQALDYLTKRLSAAPA